MAKQNLATVSRISLQCKHNLASMIFHDFVHNKMFVTVYFITVNEIK